MFSKTDNWFGKAAELAGGWKKFLICKYLKISFGGMPCVLLRDRKGVIVVESKNLYFCVQSFFTHSLKELEETQAG